MFGHFTTLCMKGLNCAVITEFRRIFPLSMVKYFAVLAKALTLEHNVIICLWNVSSLSIVIPKSSSQGLDLTVEPSIFKLVFSHGLTKKLLLPEFATILLCLNQANILLMVGPENSVAWTSFCKRKEWYHQHSLRSPNGYK